MGLLRKGAAAPPAPAGDDAGHSSAKAPPAPAPGGRPLVPANPNPLSKLLFLFMDPVIRFGHRATLEPAHLYAPAAVNIDRVHGVFEAAWQRELKTGKPDIRKAVVANSLGGIIFTGGLYCVSLAAQLVGPMMLQRISLAENQMQFQLNVIGLKMRNGLMAAIYRKCLRLSNSAMQSESTGKVVTLMSNDAQKVQDVMLAIHTLWGAPALIVVILILLYQQVGWATFPGVGVALLYTPLSTKVSAKLIGFRRALMVWTDKRVGLMNEVVNSMQMIKFYAWEGSFKAAVMDVRAREAGILKAMIWWQSLFAMLLFSGPVMMAVVVFAVYALSGHTFTASNAYTALALFNLLRLPLAFLPMMVTMLINALVALHRIGDFLTKPESGLAALRAAADGTPPGVVKARRGGAGAGAGGARAGPRGALAARSAPRADGRAPARAARPPAQVVDGTFTWDSAEGAAASLRGVSFEAAPGSLTMIVGSVGSGKSSVLSALIGQMERLSGTVAVGGRVAYVAQTAWIINDSVQENVVMGQAFDAARYRVSVDVSQLLPDLDLLPDGDATEIGDRGVTLSGGQKQRVSIARAVYADADVFLLDDPLSAVDSHVGRALFERCIRGVLAGKTVVLVTNALQFLPHADNIVWMEDGAVRAQGRYQALVEAGLNIAELVHLEGQSESESDADDVDGTETWEPAQPLQEQDEAAADADAADGRQQRASGDGSAAGSSSGGASTPPPAVAAGGGAWGSGAGDEPSGSAPSTPRAHAAARDAAAAAAAAAAKLARPSSASSLDAAAVVVGGPDAARKPAGGRKAARGSRLRKASAAGGATPLAGVGHLPPSDFASAGSVAGASLRVASAGGPPPRGLSLVRLAAEAHRNLTGVEAREKGHVSGRVLTTYIAAGGGLAVVAIIVALLAAEQGARVFTDSWLGWWAGNAFHQGVWFYIGVYTSSAVAYSLLTYLRTLRFMYTTVNAAVTLHNRLLSHILRLPKAFFDTNPAGRILNRFSRDVETMDSVLNQSMAQFCNCFAAYLAILVVISLATRWFGIAIVPITIIYVVIQRYYIPTARELQRLESVSRSPIYSKFSEALAGVATIRAYRRETYFTAASDALMELNAYAFVTQRAAASWLAMRLDFLGLVILTAAALLCIRGSIAPGLAGLCLVYALDLTRYLKHGTAMASKTESDFNSVERVVQYLTPEPEAAEETAPDVAAALPKDWPAVGAISVRGLTLRYRPGLPLVLRGVSFEVAAAEKVGLVGRTGSGKSSLLLALFRMLEASGGSISIDGVDIATLGLRQLRGAMSIIPQDPFMFSGTVRSNLDPFQSYAEPDLWRVLDAVGLRGTITALPAALDAPVVDGGNNFSQGQKQLFCMARAMLRNSRLLMLDEATASVDPETDRLIQAAIRSVFAATTMLTIAHRLNTIMDADRVLVLDQGLLVENGEPHELLQKSAGIFTGMVDQTGASSATYLKDMARSASFTRTASRSAASAAATRLAAGRLRDAARSEVLGAPYLGRDAMGGAFMATGAAFTRELSLLQRNAEAGSLPGLPAAMTRRLSAEVADGASLGRAPSGEAGGAASRTGSGSLSGSRRSREAA
ncbi:abcC12 [Scenedesmus sp. PABB004]|nr:abcC12 [Scenedesmus sp. PABB004]